ncbi:hypothetical protein, partial [Fischerella thermalis]|uniref:hypothetical protein n=1 Tax=Fischerella thermalis TaxID=372787 RepID=UPI001CA486FE
STTDTHRWTPMKRQTANTKTIGVHPCSSVFANYYPSHFATISKKLDHRYTPMDTDVDRFGDFWFFSITHCHQYVLLFKQL